MDLDQILEQLHTVDNELAEAGLTDLDSVGAVLARRNQLISQATATIDSLRQPTPEQQTALRRSREAGVSAMRHLILAKHILSTEIASLKQEQRLLTAVASQLNTSPRRQFDLEG